MKRDEEKGAICFALWCGDILKKGLKKGESIRQIKVSDKNKNEFAMPRFLLRENLWQKLQGIIPRSEMALQTPFIKESTE